MKHYQYATFFVFFLGINFFFQHSLWSFGGRSHEEEIGAAGPHKMQNPKNLKSISSRLVPIQPEKPLDNRPLYKTTLCPGLSDLGECAAKSLALANDFIENIILGGIVFFVGPTKID